MSFHRVRADMSNIYELPLERIFRMLEESRTRGWGGRFASSAGLSDGQILVARLSAIAGRPSATSLTANCVSHQPCSGAFSPARTRNKAPQIGLCELCSIEDSPMPKRGWRQERTAAGRNNPTPPTAHPRSPQQPAPAIEFGAKPPGPWLRRIAMCR